MNAPLNVSPESVIADIGLAAWGRKEIRIAEKVASAGEMLEGVRIQGLTAFAAQLKAVRGSRAHYI